MAKNKSLHKELDQFTKIFTALIFFALQGCSETIVGQKLANSFDNPGSNINSEKQSYKKSKGVTPTEKEKQPKENNQTLVKKENKPTIKKVKKIVEIKPDSFDPLPYRVTIKLSGTNPSAPAESVTKALRRAGVKFEVEMIERIEVLRKKNNSPSPRTSR